VSSQLRSLFLKQEFNAIHTQAAEIVVMVISVPQTGLSSLAGQLGENPEQALDDLIRQLSIEPRSYQQRIITSAVKMFAVT
jgi:hypothetical protein